MSDQIAVGRLENFENGWAVKAYGKSEKAHYFTRKSGAIVRAPCGAYAVPDGLLDAGTFPKCSTCSRIQGE